MKKENKQETETEYKNCDEIYKAITKSVSSNNRGKNKKKLSEKFVKIDDNVKELDFENNFGEQGMTILFNSLKGNNSVINVKIPKKNRVDEQEKIIKEKIDNLCNANFMQTNKLSFAIYSSAIKVIYKKEEQQKYTLTKFKANINNLLTATKETETKTETKDVVKEPISKILELYKPSSGSEAQFTYDNIYKGLKLKYAEEILKQKCSQVLSKLDAQEDIGDKDKEYNTKFLYKFYGTEVIKNASAIVHNLMAMQLLQKGKLQWKDIFNKGKLPMHEESLSEKREKELLLAKDWVKMKFGLEFTKLFFNDKDINPSYEEPALEILGNACKDWYGDVNES